MQAIVTGTGTSPKYLPTSFTSIWLSTQPTPKKVKTIFSYSFQLNFFTRFFTISPAYYRFFMLERQP